MSTKAPPPCPPPRPDLETDSPLPKPSKAAPPPIPLRPDLGEGTNDNVVSIPKIPPPTLPKKPSFKKKQGRPEISVFSAQPKSSSGAFIPFVPIPSTSDTQIASQSSAYEREHVPIEPFNTSNDPALVTKPYVIPAHGPKSVNIRPSSFDVTPVQSEAPSVIIKPVFSPETTSSTPQPAPEPCPLVEPTQPVMTPSSNLVVIHSDEESPNAIMQTKKTAPQLPRNTFKEKSPPKAIKSTKPREPPQRPKSKPVCEPSLGSDPFQVGFQSNMVGERKEESIVPKVTKKKSNNVVQESGVEDFKIDNYALQEPNAIQIDSMIMTDEGLEFRKEKELVPSKKAKSFPTVIRTKPSGKEKSEASPSYQDDVVQLENTQVRYTKPSVIKAQSRNKPPPPPPQATQKTTQDNSTVSIAPIVETQPQQAKGKAKPTIIIPKTKKEDVKKKELMSISPKPVTTDVESEDHFSEEKTSKTKKMPNIIRPNRQKKDRNKPDNGQSNMRELPEWQSQDGTQGKLKIVPVRKAPPRPSPPKSGPQRPGPPKMPANEHSLPTMKTQQARTVTAEGIYMEYSGKGKPHTKPATIGKEKGTEKSQVKRNETTVVSSVVETKIEPSCIALYDYASSNIDDLSFQAGDEIFLVRRVNQDWYIGRLGDCEGMIPVKFVEIIEDLPVEVTEKSHDKVSVQISQFSMNASVFYDFVGQSNDELTLHAGDSVLLLELINDDWLKGTCNGMTGMFPSTFVNFTQEMKQKLLSQEKHVKNDNNMGLASSGPRCKALYDYQTKNDGDLSFNANDIIKLTERINAEWLMGELYGQQGMFPAEYVEILEDLISASSGANVSLKGSLISSYPIAKALHDYISDTDGDLSFREGDMVTILNKVSDEWLEGMVNGEKGIFPTAFVENVPVLCSLENSKPQDHLLPKAIALYDFKGESDQELSFKTGDEILLLQHINTDWIEGEVNNRVGQFPTAFVEILVPLP